MIRLNLAREPRTLDLGHGVTVTVVPLSSALMLAAKDRLAERRKAGEDIRAIDLIKVIGCLAIMAWDGVADEDGSPAPVSDESVSALLDLYVISEKFNEVYVSPALTLEAEKNAFAPSLNGTSAGAKTIAAPARSRAKSARIQ